jgi:hypothetical protein
MVCAEDDLCTETSLSDSTRLSTDHEVRAETRLSAGGDVCSCQDLRAGGNEECCAEIGGPESRAVARRRTGPCGA